MIDTLVDKILGKKVYTDGEKEIYAYGLKHMLILLFNLVFILTISTFQGTLLFTLGFLLYYYFKRQYAGGYHANTDLGCFISSVVICSGVNYLYLHISLVLWQQVIVVIPLLILIAIISPIEDHHKPLDDLEKSVYKSRLIKVILFEVLFWILSILSQVTFLQMSFLFSTFTIFLMLIAGVIKNYIIRLLQREP